MQIKAVASDCADSHTGEQDVEAAVALAGFGKFNIKVLILCGLIYLNSGFSISSVGLVLPSAACDFELTTIDKGRISAAPMLGMLLSAYFWGCYADLKGRKKALLIAMFAYAFTEIVSSVVPNYWGFLVLKFFSGFSINCHSAVVFTYLGEFQPVKMREKMLSWLEMAWSIGLIALPLVGWAIIPLKLSFELHGFFFRSWNLFVFICALPSLLIGLWLLTFPETPKFLAETGNNVKLARTLDIMHRENTGESFEKYLELLSKNGYDHVASKLKVPKVEKTPESVKISPQRTAELFKTIYTQTLKLLQPPLLQKTAEVCTIMFCLGSSYYALMLWFPELFQRFVQFESSFPGDSASVCVVSDKKHAVNETVNQCPTTVSKDVYSHTLILGISCIPFSVMLPLFVDKLGYKFYLVVSSFIASAVTLGLLFVNSSIQNLILSCIFEATCSIGMSIIFCVIVDLFPTNLRAIAAALCAFCGRFGALVGNSLFGYLIDSHCLVLIIIVAGKLLVCAVVGYLLPIHRRLKTVSSDKLDPPTFRSIPEA